MVIWMQRAKTCLQTSSRKIAVKVASNSRGGPNKSPQADSCNQPKPPAKPLSKLSFNFFSKELQMKSATLIKGLTFGALLASSSLFSSVSFAGADDGVRCPSGYNASFSSGVMKCSKQVQTVAETRPSVCPLIPFVGTQYIQNTNAADKCRRSDNGSLVSTVIGGVPVLDPQNWDRQIDGATGALDRFIKPGATHTEYAYPQAVNLL
jgi:hypothetical protein